MYTRIFAMSPPTTTTAPAPTPTPDPYAAKVVTPNVPKGLPGAPIPAPVSIIPDFASQNASAAAAHNRLVQANSGGKVGGSRTKSKSKSKSRSKFKSKSKRRTKSKKSKRGGASIPTPTPTPTPTAVKAVTVPQFPGSTSANAASVGGNHLAMKQAAQAALDNTNAPPTYTKLA